MRVNLMSIIVWVIALLTIMTHMNKSQLVTTTIFSATINSFMASDPKHINSNAYEAFANNPKSFVDKNGRAPESSVQILTNRFGDEHVRFYRGFDFAIQNGSQQFLGRVNNDALYYYEQINSQVEKMILEQISPEFPPGRRMPEMCLRVYTSGTRGLISNQFSRTPNQEDTYFRMADLGSVASNSHYLSHQAAEAHIESSGIGRRIFIQERRIWRNESLGLMPMYLPPIGEIYEGRPIFEGPERRMLTADELAVLYEHPNYTHSQQLRGFLNHHTMSTPWTFPTHEGNQIAYQNFRRRFIRIRGISNSEVVVPFQPLRFRP